MRSAIAILTYNRLDAVRNCVYSTGLAGLIKKYPIAVFEDAGFRDGTRAWLSRLPRMRRVEEDDELDAVHYESPGELSVFLGRANLGVAGNSNRALRWFERQKDVDHLLLINDDIVFTGDALAQYAAAHTSTDIGLFCFNDFDAFEYKGITVPVAGTELRVFDRMTGSVMSLTREAFDAVGYYDTRFHKFGQEHVEYTHRVRMAGLMDVDGQPQPCVDVAGGLLRGQSLASCLSDAEKEAAYAVSNRAMESAGAWTLVDGLHRPFKLREVPRIGVGTVGIPSQAATPVVVNLADCPLHAT